MQFRTRVGSEIWKKGRSTLVSGTAVYKLSLFKSRRAHAKPNSLETSLSVYACSCRGQEPFSANCQNCAHTRTFTVTLILTIVHTKTHNATHVYANTHITITLTLVAVAAEAEEVSRNSSPGGNCNNPDFAQRHTRRCCSSGYSSNFDFFTTWFSGGIVC